jgi:hypothetical protein
MELGSKKLLDGETSGDAALLWIWRSLTQRHPLHFRPIPSLPGPADETL